MKLLLFDLDGTLVSTGGSGLRALDRAFESLHQVSRATEGISPAGKTDPAIVREIFEKKLSRPAEPDEVQAVCESYLGFLPEEIERGTTYRVLKGIPDLLADLSGRDDLILALGTGNLERGARIKLGPSGLNGFFAFGGFGSDAEERPKVLLAAVRRAEERLGRPLAKRDVYVIGDTILDVMAGKAIGAVTVAVAAGHGKIPDLQASQPDIFMENFLDARPLQKRL